MPLSCAARWMSTSDVEKRVKLIGCLSIVLICGVESESYFCAPFIIVTDPFTWPSA